MTSQTSAGQQSPRALLWPTILLLGLAILAVLIFLNPMWAVLVLVALASLVITWRYPFGSLGALVVLLPFHEGIQRILTWQWGWAASRITLFSLWKEGLILLLFAVMILQHLTKPERRIRYKVYHFDLWLVALALLSAAYIVVAATGEIGVFGFRNYFEPIALLFLARLMPYSRRDLRRLLIVLALVAALVAAYGIYQALFIDFATMVQLGYVDEFGNLPFAFKTALRDAQPRPRAISTVTGPNQLAIYLNLFILLCGYALLYMGQQGQVAGDNQSLRSRYRLGSTLPLLALILLYGACLLLTYSRGGLVALGASILAGAAIYLYDRGLKRTWREITSNKLVMAGLVALIILALVGVVVSGFGQRVWRGLTGQDPAALGHVDSLVYAVNFVTENPVGTGMGMAGPRALRFQRESEIPLEIEHTESTYLQFGMEMGIFGMLLLMLFFLSLIATLWRLRKRQKQRGDLEAQMLTEVALVAWIGMLAVFTVTPLMQNFLVASYLWLMAGFAFHLDAYARPASVEPKRAEG
ncbi:MAG: O-antigen ligase family protein [Chloroflexota bacterium]|nr:O-antigen ligase family protein [Chloroflexota bacterium]